MIMIGKGRGDINGVRASKVSLAALLLFLISLTSLSTVSAEISRNSCTTQELASQTNTIAHPFTGQQEIGFASASPQYQADAAQFTAQVSSGATDTWSYDANCMISWNKATVTFVMRAANSSEYSLIVSENPRLGVVYSISIIRFANAGPPSSGCNQYNGLGQLQCEWAGWAVAGNSGASAQVYYADSIWYVQKATAPTSSQTCTTAHNCEISQWDGLTDANGASIIQGGTDSWLVTGGNPANSYDAWVAIYNDPHSFEDYCTAPSSGDEMEAVMENQLVYAGTSGSNYELFLRDWTTSNLCTPSGTYTNPVSVSFTPTYAAFEAELINPTSDVLASFGSMEFYSCQFALSASVTGVWNYWHSGDGFGSSIYNHGYNETYPAGMNHNSGTYVGYFGVNYLTSNGTPA